MSVFKSILIVDDEELARRKIRRFLEQISSEFSILEVDDGLEAYKLILDQKPDLVFLDINMPGLSGIEVVESVLKDDMPAFLFTTAYSEHAIKAFDLNAVDYLLKPFDFHRFKAAYERALIMKRGTVSPVSQVIPKVPLTRFLVRENNQISAIDVKDICYFKADDKYIEIYTEDSTKLIRGNLKQLEVDLNSSTFVRIHRSYIMNLSYMDRMESMSHGDYNIHLKNGCVLPLSRRYAENLKHLIIG
jgi:two-component system LytT family response regulator